MQGYSLFILNNVLLPMTPICPDPLTQAIKRLMKDIDLMTDKDAIDINPQKLDTHARSISTHLKALQDLDNYNAAAAKAAHEKKYTSYEDLPPPSPEDRKRFYGRLQSLIGEAYDWGEEVE